MLSFASLLSFLNAEPTSRCFVEGERIINSKFIVQCGKMTDNLTGEVEILGLVLQTSALFDKPHEITGVLSLQGKVEIKSMKCTCKAGIRCKHIAAVLIYFTRNNILDVEVLSKTDVKRLWGIRKGPISEQFSTKKLSETDCWRQLFKKVTLPPIKADEDYFRRLNACVPKSCQALSMAGRKILGEGTSNIFPQSKDKSILENLFRNISSSPIGCEDVDLDVLPACCRKQISQLSLSNPVGICETTKVSINSRNKERQFRITGSRCYSLFTYSKGDWEVKSSKYFWPKAFSNKFTKHGLKYEPQARNLFETAFKVEVLETGVIVNAKFPWLSYSPDGIILQEGSPFKLLEIKCPFKGLNETIASVIPSLKYIDILEDGNYKLKAKHSYYAQVQFGMAILNLPFCEFMVYSPFDNSFLLITIPYDEEFAINLVNKLNSIYLTNMVHNICINT